MINHSYIVSYFKKLATDFIPIKDFFRMDLTEINGAFRSSAEFPCMVLEVIEGDLNDSNIMNSVVSRSWAFTIYTNPANDDYEEQNEKLNLSEELGLKILARLRHDNILRDHKLYNTFKVEDVTYNKVGPIFSERLYGYRFSGTFTKNNPLKVDVNDWKTDPNLCN